MWLIDAQQKDTLSRTEVSGGRFLFKGIVEEPFFAYVGNGKQRVHLILEAGSVTVDINERVSSGTPMEDRYAAFHRRFYGFGREQREEKSALADSVVRANPDNLVGALALEDLAHVDKDRFLALYPGMSEEMQRFYLLKQAYDAIGVQEKTAPGQFFTDYLVPGGNPTMWAGANTFCWTTGPPGVVPARPRCPTSGKPGRLSTVSVSRWWALP